MSGKLIVVSGGQYGSEAKGHVSGMLLSPERNRNARTFGVRVGGPNAGHVIMGKCPPWCAGGSVSDEGQWGWEPAEDHQMTLGDGSRSDRPHPWKLRQVPVAAVASPGAVLVIAAGSEVHFPTLHEELIALDAAGYGASGRMMVDAAATRLTQDHIDTERHSNLTERLGSTAKGIGAARADRIWRLAATVGDPSSKCGRFELTHDDTAGYLRNRLAEGGTVLIEGTQGYGLGLHRESYPQVTSGDCRAIDFLAQAGLSPWHPSVGRFESWVVLRTRPIRVAGNSGPMKEETSWGEIGLREEKTTVTKKVRRVGGWDPELARAAIEANGGQVTRVALTMLDQLVPELAGANSFEELDDVVKYRVLSHTQQVEKDLDHGIDWVGTGPDSGLWL